MDRATDGNFLAGAFICGATIYVFRSPETSIILLLIGIGLLYWANER